MDVYEEKAEAYCNETYGERDELTEIDIHTWNALYDAHIAGQNAANDEVEIEEEDRSEELAEAKEYYEGKYFKIITPSKRVFLYIKKVYNDCGDLYIVFDELQVTDYKQISYSVDRETYGFGSELEEIPKEEWISEMCYYFKRIPGEDICCPE